MGRDRLVAGNRGRPSDRQRVGVLADRYRYRSVVPAGAKIETSIWMRRGQSVELVEEPADRSAGRGAAGATVFRRVVAKVELNLGRAT